MQPRDFRTEKEKLNPTLTPSEFAKLLGVSAASVRGWVDSGVLRPRVILRSGRYQFTEEQIATYRNDEAVREFLRKVYIAEGGRSVEPIPKMKAKKKTRRKRRSVDQSPDPDLLTPAQAAERLHVGPDTLRKWRARKVFLPLIVLPNGQPRYSHLQVTTFSPDVIYHVAKEEMRKIGPGYEKWLRGFHQSSIERWEVSPLRRELWPHPDAAPTPMALRLRRE